MKVFPFSKLKTLAGILVFDLVLAGVVYLVVLPFLAPASPAPGADALAAWNMRLAAVVFLAAFLSTALVAMGILYFAQNDRCRQNIVDAIRLPTLVVDAENRYLAFNREAERILGLNREKDIGGAAAPGLLSVLSAGPVDPSSFALKGVIELENRHYQVLDNPLPEENDSVAGRRRVVFLRDVTDQVRLKEALREVNQTMGVLNANSLKIANSSVSLSQGATEQASSLAAITASMSEFSKKIQGNTETSAKGTQLAAQAREAAERSGNEIAHALTAMNDVQDAGVRIARIVKLIDDIAFQTNLLALNAAVEAARAGRQGKGFAVVADEVRNLAGRSAKAAKDTASMVEDVTERIGNASHYISKLEEMLRNIVQDAIRMADSSASASATSAEQAAGILHVNQELGQMNSVTHSTMSAAEQTATAVEVLARQVETLKQRLDGLNEEFSIDNGADWSAGSPKPKKPKTRAINLLDEPESGSEPARTHSYLEQENFPHGFGEADYEGPYKRASGRSGNDWNLNDALEDDSPLAKLMRTDGYHEEGYNSFREPGDKPRTDPFHMDLSGLDKEAGEFKTAEGDRVVKPNQNILLDDSEFGRY